MTYSFKKDFTRRIKSVAYSMLTNDEIEQLLNYLWIFKTQDCSAHYEVNQYISNNDLWEDFSELRSLNDHGYRKRIRGIAPHFYAIACGAMNMAKGDGQPLEDYERY